MIDPGLGVAALAGPAAGRPVAGSVVFAWGETAIGKFQASDPDSWELRPNHLLNWAVLRCPCCWNALPREAARWWRHRAAADSVAALPGARARRVRRNAAGDTEVMP
ncbi:MAG TPA: hypothetical protein VKF59_14190 [Candidatus Dormibacteraeota bacterium]|nr:hypothetical protein [Candidatus Dormibacteraeota bacterium]